VQAVVDFLPAYQQPYVRRLMICAMVKNPDIGLWMKAVAENLRPVIANFAFYEIEFIHVTVQDRMATRGEPIADACLETRSILLIPDVCTDLRNTDFRNDADMRLYPQPHPAIAHPKRR